MNTKHQVLNRKIIFFVSLKLNMWKCKNKKTSHTEAHITEILQSRHNRKKGHACGTGQFKDENPLSNM